MPLSNVELAGRWFEGLDRDGIPPLDLCDERITIVNVREFIVQGRYEGHAGVRQWVTEAFDVVEDRRFELLETVDAGDDETLVSVQRAVGHSRSTGLEFDLRWAAVWTIRDGKVLRLHGYLTKRAALEAVAGGA